MKRTQIQIAIDALRKQLAKYEEQHKKAVESMSASLKSKEFFEVEINRLKTQIKQLSTPTEEERKALEADKVLKALEG